MNHYDPFHSHDLDYMYLDFASMNHLEVKIPEWPHTKEKTSAFSLKEQIIENIQEIYDPEIPINIWDLGLIYSIEVFEEKRKVEITMTLTTPNCPSAQTLPSVCEMAAKVLGLETQLVLTFEPPWDPKKISEDAKMLMLMEYGVDPDEMGK